MPSLILEPTYTSAQVLYAQWSDHAPANRRPSHSARVDWACRLHLHSHVRVSSGAWLQSDNADKRAIPGSVTVLPATDAGTGTTTGSLGLYSGRAGSAFQVTLFVASELFARIARHADARFLPTVSLMLKEDAGITINAALDLDWDDAHHPEAEVVACELWWRTLSHDPLLAPPRPDPLAQISSVLTWLQNKGAWALLAVLAALGVARWLFK